MPDLCWSGVCHEHVRGSHVSRDLPRGGFRGRMAQQLDERAFPSPPDKTLSAIRPEIGPRCCRFARRRHQRRAGPGAGGCRRRRSAFVCGQLAVRNEGGQLRDQGHHLRVFHIFGHPRACCILSPRRSVLSLALLRHLSLRSVRRRGGDRSPAPTWTLSKTAYTAVADHGFPGHIDPLPEQQAENAVEGQSGRAYARSGACADGVSPGNSASMSSRKERMSARSLALPYRLTLRVSSSW